MLCTKCAVEKAGLSTSARGPLFSYLAALDWHRPYNRSFSQYSYRRNDNERKNSGSIESGGGTKAKSRKTINYNRGGFKKHKSDGVDTTQRQTADAPQDASKVNLPSLHGDMSDRSWVVGASISSEQQHALITHTPGPGVTNGLEQTTGASEVGGGNLTEETKHGLFNQPDAPKTLTKHETRALSALVQKLARNLVPQSSTASQRSREEVVQEVYRKMPILKNFPEIAHEASARFSAAAKQTQESSVEGEESVIEEQNKQESWRIQQKILDAHTDGEIWAILKEEFFDKVQDLEQGLDMPSLKAQPPKTEEQEKVTDQHNNKTAKGQNQREIVGIFAKLYPYMLVFALRRLSATFERSPRISSLLPAVKALGITSYVMGASNTLYNELLRHRWHVFNDLRGVLILLAEMETAGLETTPTTVDILQDIVAHQQKARNGDLGPCLKNLENMTERQYLGERILQWRRKISRELQERRTDAAKRKQIERQLIQDEILALNEQE